MQKYDIVIRATITKTIRIEADSLEAATEEAHETFSVLTDDYDEDYNQETVDAGLAED